MSRPALLALAALTWTIGCGADPAASGGSGPIDSTVPEDSLRFLRPASTAPALGTRQVSFWAVQGENREIRLMYQRAAGQTDSVEFLRFRVDNKSLVNDTAGHPIAPGDSLLITLTIADTLRLITDFQPAGLVFNPGRPARLWLKFAEADPDLNHDGQITAADTTLLLGLGIWKQEHPGDPWSLLTSLVNTTSQDVEADIPGFTRYAVAY